MSDHDQPDELHDDGAELSLLKLLKAKNLCPVKRTHHVNGSTTYTWHVNNNDDLYVQVMDSVKRSGNFLVVVRFVDDAKACVVPKASDVACVVEAWTASLQAKSRGAWKHG